MYAPFTDISHAAISKNANADKKTRKHEGNADLVALFNGVSPTVNTNPADRATFMWDNINVPQVINMMAARVVTGDIDCCHHNYYFYRDTEGTGQWMVLPWDVDLSFGRNATSVNTYWDDAMFPNNGIDVGNNNYFFQLVLGSGPAAAPGSPQSRQMFLRRLRTLLDELLQPTNTPPAERYYEKLIAEHDAKMNADAAVDLVKWGAWGRGSPVVRKDDAMHLSVTQAVEQLQNYLVERRVALLHARTASGATEIPPSQPTNVVIGIGKVEFDSGDADQDDIQLVNTNQICVDLSGWKLSGAVDFTFPGGAVIMSNGFAHVSPNVRAFRQRMTAPWGERLLILGAYQRQLRNERLSLTDALGRVVATNSYVIAPIRTR